MASKIIKGLTIQIGADTLGLNTALKDVESKSRTASSELREISSAIKISGDSAILWKQKQQILNDALERSKEKVKILEDAQKDFKERFKNGEIDNGAYDKFQEKLTKSKNVLAILKSQQEQYEAKFKSGEIDQGKYDKFCKSVENVEKRVKKLETAEHSMEENLRLGNISEEQYRAFQRETEYARAAVEKYEAGLKEANQKVIELGNESDHTADDVKELGNKADNTASGGISAMTVALGNLVADGIKKAASELKDFTKDIIQTGADFEAAMSNVAAISGADKTGLEQLTAKAEEMGATTKFTARESADAFQYMAMAGWKTEDMLGGIEGIMSLAAASGEDLATTSDIVTDALTAFGLTAGDSGHFADVLAAASSNANTNVAMMGETFKYVAPVAGALNFSVEDTAEAIGLMANSGIKASQAGTSLRAILTAMTDTSDKAYFAFQELGIETVNADGSMRSLNEILTDLRSSWQGLAEAEQADYAQRIAGKEAMSGFLSLVNAAPADIEKLSDAIRDCDGAAGDMSTTMTDNLQGDITILGSAVDGMKISLSKKLNPALRDVTQYITSKMPEIEKVLEKAGGKAIKVLDFSVKNLPKAIDFLKKMMPVIKGVGVKFAAWKIAEKAKPGAAALKNLFSSVKSGNSVMQVLNATLKANPIGAVTTAIGAATTAIELFRSSAKRKEEDRRESLAALIKDEYKEAAERIKDTSDSMKDMKDSFNEQAGTIEAETGRTQALWEELQALADASGNVKEADKIRADYILGELNDALGTEYTMTGNQIDNYKTMQTEVDKLIEKKRALAYIDAYAADSVEYEKLRTQSLEDYAANKTDFDEYYKQMENIRIKASQLTGRYIADENELDDLLNNLDLTGNDLQNSGVDLNALKKLVDPYNNLIGNYKAARDNMNEALANYNKANAFFDINDEALKAASEGRYDEVGSILYASSNANITAYKNADEDDAKRAEAFKKALIEQLNALDLALKSGRSDTVNATIATLGDIVKDGKKYGFELGDEFTDGLKIKVKEMTDKDFDVSGIVEMGQECGIDTGKVWSGEFRDLVQAQINSGYDIRGMLAWGERSGGLTASDYNGKFGHEVQNYISSMYPDTEGLMQWAAERGMTLGELFGENFTNYANAYMEAQFWESGNAVKTISSAWDAAQYAAGRYKPDIPMFAAGGFLGSGKGIVAEAGPELIEIINGGAKITPLTGSARNTPVASAGSSRNVYINNTINASVSGGYDVRRLAEDLAGEQRRVERNMGL